MLKKDFHKNNFVIKNLSEEFIKAYKFIKLRFLPFWFYKAMFYLVYLLFMCFLNKSLSEVVIISFQGKIACANVLSDLYAMGVTECDNMLMLLGVSNKMTDKERDVVVPIMMRGFKVRILFCLCSCPFYLFFF